MRPKPIDFYVIPQVPLDITVSDVDEVWKSITAADDRAKYGDKLTFEPSLDTGYLFDLDKTYYFQMPALYAPQIEFRSNNRIDVDKIHAESIRETRLPKSQVEVVLKHWLKLDYTIRIGTRTLRHLGENRFLYLVALVITKLTQGHTLVDPIFFISYPNGLCSYDTLLKVFPASECIDC